MVANRLQKFPNDYIFNQLLQSTQEIHGNIINDTFGLEVDYTRFFQDVLRICSALRRSLPSSIFNSQGLMKENASNICVLTLGGYEFIISFYSILAIGGASVPLASGVLPEEAAYFMEKSQSSCILFADDRLAQVTGIKRYMEERENKETICISLPRVKEQTDLTINFEIDNQIVPSPSQPALIIFTSGTSGKPKGVVLPRRRFHWKRVKGKSDTTLAYRPPHWIGGARSLLQPVLSGETLYILPNRAGPEVFWGSLREGHISRLSITPTLLRQLKDYYVQHIRDLSPDVVAEYVAGVRILKEIACSSAMIDPGTLEFWKDICRNVPICNVYVLTEVGIVTKTHPDSSIKVSQSNFPKVITERLLFFNPYNVYSVGPTSQCFSYEQISLFVYEGYFKTGDLLRRVGDEYVFEGRVATDFILFYGYRIPILELESSLMNLPYILEAFVIGAPDHEAKELPAAIVRLRKPYHSPHERLSGAELPGDYHITLQRIRRDLSATLAIHKLPAMLRILNDGEDVPRTPSDKPIKRGLLKNFFNISDFVTPKYCEPNVEYWGNHCEQTRSQTRPWDWCGLKRDD
ncbi:hypothetical protein F5884DRAFT_865877 [Xylogone sp. PMI_703]|nr:hypothetical protein F5884DRAFT_865877 [Xylogone sp. PMI_703]